MKILNIFKGFTTNSSSSSEWLEPTWEKDGSISTSTESTPKPSPVVDNILTVCGIVLTLVGIFALERIARRWLKSKKRDDDDE